MTNLVNRWGVRHEGQTHGRLFGCQFGPVFEEKNGRTRPVILDLKADADHNPVRPGFPFFSVPFKSKTPARGGSGYFLDPGIQSGPYVPLASDRPDGDSFMRRLPYPEVQESQTGANQTCDSEKSGCNSVGGPSNLRMPSRP
jgi:hypothetical protein